MCCRENLRTAWPLGTARTRTVSVQTRASRYGTLENGINLELQKSPRRDLPVTRRKAPEFLAHAADHTGSATIPFVE